MIKYTVWLHLCLGAGNKRSLEAIEYYGNAKEIFEISAKKLGLGLSVVIDILNPEIIVIGSVFARNYDLMHPVAREVIDKEALSYAASDELPVVLVNVMRAGPGLGSIYPAQGDYYQSVYDREQRE